MAERPAKYRQEIKQVSILLDPSSLSVIVSVGVMREQRSVEERRANGHASMRPDVLLRSYADEMPSLYQRDDYKMGIT